MISDLKKYAQKGYNVLLEGRRGGGKTSMVKEVFNEVYGVEGRDWKYFSAATMDPWIHLLGIPKIVKHEEYGEVTRAIPAEAMLNPNIKAIFVDEINRGVEELRNGLMEIIDTKSVNGVRLPNLQTVWAAMNPADQDEGYDVEPMDPAQLDRFPCWIQVSCIPSMTYFRKHFGEDGEEAVKWWRSLPKKGQEQISPRRLEKLVCGIRDEVNIKPMVPDTISVSDLEGRILDAKRKESLEHMLKDERVPLEAKQQAIKDQVVRAKAKAVISLREVAEVIGDQVLFEMLERMPRKMVEKNRDAVTFCVQQEKAKGATESRWTVKAGASGVTAGAMTSLVPNKDGQSGLASNLDPDDEVILEKIAECYDAVLAEVALSNDPADTLSNIETILSRHGKVLEGAGANQLGLGWALHVKQQLGKKGGSSNFAGSVMTHHFRKAALHERKPELLYRWLVGIGVGNAWIRLVDKDAWKKRAQVSDLAKLGLKFLGNGDTRMVLANLSLHDDWTDRHGTSAERLKIGMQIHHKKMPSLQNAFFKARASVSEEDEDDVAVA